MIRVLVRRLITLPLLLLGVTLLLFVFSQVFPGDPVALYVGDLASVEVREAARVKLGLDEPVPVQYIRYLERLAEGDLGDSIRYGLPVSTMIANAFPATFQLLLGGIFIAVVIAFPLGLLAAANRDTWIDVFARSLGVFGMAAPGFFLGIVAILIFAFQFGLFPVSGRGDPPDLAHMVLPCAVLGWRYAGNSTRLLRASLIDALNQDYIRSARSRGIDEGTIVRKYAFRNALIPTLTDLGVDFANVIGNVVLIETVFAWPGLGRLVYLGILWNDFALLSGAVLVLIVYAVVVNIIVDALYGAIDPRIRVS
jgi:peptide/nickel transport system permease protein